MKHVTLWNNYLAICSDLQCQAYTLTEILELPFFALFIAVMTLLLKWKKDGLLFHLLYVVGPLYGYLLLFASFKYSYDLLLC